MKKLVTLSMCMLGIFAATAQTLNQDATGKALPIAERTPQLEALYQQEDYLNEYGTAQEIEANRMAIKNAWTAIDPTIGDLYTPINAPKYARLGEGPIPYIPTEIIERPEPLPMTRDWGDDILVRNDFVDGMDMTATLNTGDLYLGMYENDIDAGGAADGIYMYRSTDNGVTWDLFASADSPTPIRKIQLVSLDGTGDQYILAFLYFEGGLFQAARWNTATAAFDFQTVDTGVADFSVDRNFPVATNGMRVLATYLKDDACATEVYSARSTAGEYGFGWVDAVSVETVCGRQIDFAYARAGDAFVTYTGAGSGNLYVNSNTNFNDPMSWTPRETLENGNVRETLNPTIRAARLDIPSGKVVVWASDRADGATGNFNGVGYLGESGGAFSVFSNFVSGGANFNIAHTDGWIRKVAGLETIRFTYVRDNIDNSGNSVNRSITFNGTDFDTFEAVADGPVNVFDGFPSVTAETADLEPCMAFAGTNSGRGFGLYFDTRAEVPLAVDENTIDGLTYFPNPTSTVLNVRANTNLNGVQVYSITGAKVLDIENDELTNSISVNTRSLAAGIYVMRVTAGSQIGTYKVVKQ
jgi:hypothetical protein